MEDDSTIQRQALSGRVDKQAILIVLVNNRRAPVPFPSAATFAISICSSAAPVPPPAPLSHLLLRIQAEGKVFFFLFLFVCELPNLGSSVETFIRNQSPHSPPRSLVYTWHPPLNPVWVLLKIHKAVFPPLPIGDLGSPRETMKKSRPTAVLPYKTPSLREHYQLGKKLGQGQFGTTFLCTDKATGQRYACKSIPKRKLLCREDYEDVYREIQIMHHLSEHPNVVRIRGAYEDTLFVHLVMELCAGGELFDRIVEKGHYSEKKAAHLIKTIVGVVEACHSLGVMHRDLKPENFLLLSEDEDSALKATDFGLSVFCKPGDTFFDVVGSPYYVAPEVLQKCYGPEADVWSAGVILYILLSGVPPFWAETEAGIFRQILHGRLDFESEPWPTISDGAKDLIRSMLNRNPKKRYTAHEVLCHPWIVDDKLAPDRPLDSAVLTRLKHFSAMNKLKKMALRFIAERLSEDEIGGLKELFKMIDTDNSGSITFEELRDGLRRVGSELMESEIQALMEAADIDNSGSIDYGEFIAATIHMNKMEREENLVSAFSYFDKDGSGYITIDELQQACKEFGLSDFHLDEMIKEIDQNNDGQIDYSEFAAMMRMGNGGIGRKTMRSNINANLGDVFRAAESKSKS